jgi:hypothetical protein
MKRGRYSEEQIVGILKEHEAGRKMVELPTMQKSMYSGEECTIALTVGGPERGMIRSSSS